MDTRKSSHVRTCGVLLLLVLLSQTARAVEPKREFYVINLKPPSVTVIDATTMKIAAEVPLDSEPTYAVIHPANRYLYVLEEGIYRTNGTLKPAQSKLAVIDLDSRTKLKTIPIAWNTRNLALSRDGKYLVCVSEGKGVSKKNLPEENGSVTIFDTAKNEIAATMSAGPRGVQAAYTSDMSRLVVFSRGEEPKKKGKLYTKPAVTIFALEQEKPLATIEFDRAAEIALSPDEKFLYVLDRGVPSKKPAENKNGTLSIIDMATAKLVKMHDVAVQPQGLAMDPETDSLFVLAQNSIKEKQGQLFRFRGAELDQTNEIGREPQFIRSFGNHSGNFVISFEDLRVVPESGPISSSHIDLNRNKGEAATAAKTLGGDVPGETLYLPQQKKLVTTVRNKYGVPTSKVAILDMETLQVQQLVTTGRGSVKFGKFMGAMALSMAMSGLSYYASYSLASSTGQPYFFYTVYVYTPAAPNLELAASPDERFAYALNTSTNDVTIIKVADGTVVDKIAVGGSCRRVALAPGGRFVYSFTPGQVDLIDTTSNKRHLEHKLSSGKVNSLHVMAQDKRLAALTSDAVLIFDTDKGSLESKVEGMHQACMLVEPAQPDK